MGIHNHSVPKSHPHEQSLDGAISLNIGEVDSIPPISNYIQHQNIQVRHG